MFHFTFQSHINYYSSLAIINFHRSRSALPNNEHYTFFFYRFFLSAHTKDVESMFIANLYKHYYVAQSSKDSIIMLLKDLILVM